MNWTKYFESVGIRQGSKHMRDYEYLKLRIKHMDSLTPAQYEEAVTAAAKYVGI